MAKNTYFSFQQALAAVFFSRNEDQVSSEKNQITAPTIGIESAIDGNRLQLQNNGSRQLKNYHPSHNKVLKKALKLLALHPESGSNFPKEKKMRIPAHILQDILAKLERFEIELGFLKNSISLQQLAADFGTNYNYLSKSVNFSKGKNFARYINDLRVTYIFEELKINRLFRKYSVKAIAFEIGFNSTECFSKSFHRKFGIYPSVYLKQLNEELNKKY